MKSENLLLAAVFFVVSSCPLAGAAPKPVETPVDVRVLPVGETPPLVMRLEEGRYVQASYPPGEAPPAKVMLREEKGAKPVSLSLNRMNRIHGGVKPGASLVLAPVAARPGVAPAPWCEAALPPDSRKVVVLLRPSADAKWNRPTALALDVSPLKIGPAGLRVMNLGASPLSGRIGEMSVILKPGETLSVPSGGPKGARLFRFASADDKGGYVAEIDRTVVVRGDTVHFMLIYPSRNVPGKSVAVCEFSERLPSPDKNGLAMDDD